MRTTFLLATCLVLFTAASAQETSPAKSAHPAATPAAQSPKAILQAYVSAWNRHDFAAFDALLAPDGTHEDIAAGFRGKGPAEIKNFMRDMLKGQPDLNWQLTTVIQSGSIVAAEWTWTSTYTGDSPSGPQVARRISGRGASVAVIENGRIKRFTDYYDMGSYFPTTGSGH
jgi:steroid delta-isomerase-like uncharacterized protein